MVELLTIIGDNANSARPYYNTEDATNVIIFASEILAKFQKKSKEDSATIEVSALVDCIHCLTPDWAGVGMHIFGRGLSCRCLSF